MFCSQCGQELPDHSRFCIACGVPQTSAQNPATQAPPQAFAHPNNTADVKATAQQFGQAAKAKAGGLFGNLKNLAGGALAGMQKPAEPQIPTYPGGNAPPAFTSPPVPTPTPTPRPVAVSVPSLGESETLPPPGSAPYHYPSGAPETLPDPEEEGEAPETVDFFKIDLGPEEPDIQVSADLCAGEYTPATQSGYWVVTNKCLAFFPFDPYNEEGIKFDYYEQEAAGNYSRLIYLRDIHSVHALGAGIGKSCTIYTYSGRHFVTDMMNKPYKGFKEAILKYAPGLLFVEVTMAEYRPSISKRDPRNPFGVRYNKEYPRGYVVAEIKKLKKDPHGIDDAIAAAKRDGSLPSSWNVLTEGISRDHTPPGVPCLFAPGT
jgi:hypothetical protein